MLNALLALVPVSVFLGGLVLLDSFKLVPLRAVLRLILAGAVAAFLCARLHGWLLDSGLVFRTGRSPATSRPSRKGCSRRSPLLYLVARKRVGFLVDAAILGFSVGRDSLSSRTSSTFVPWGRAASSSGSSGASAPPCARRYDVDPRGRREKARGPPPARRHRRALPGLAVAVAIHSLYNHFILPPVLASSLLFVTLPVLLVAVFARSERGTREWLAAGFDSEVDLLQTTLGQDVSQTRVGRYLLSLKSRFEGPVVADMMCLLRVHLELSIRAKGILMAREAGLPIEVGEDVRANLTSFATSSARSDRRAGWPCSRCSRLRAGTSGRSTCSKPGRHRHGPGFRGLTSGGLRDQLLGEWL